MVRDVIISLHFLASLVAHDHSRPRWFFFLYLFPSIVIILYLLFF
jgi:hypothetical protein